MELQISTIFLILSQPSVQGGWNLEDTASDHELFWETHGNGCSGENMRQIYFR